MNKYFQELLNCVADIRDRNGVPLVLKITSENHENANDINSETIIFPKYLGPIQEKIQNNSYSKIETLSKEIVAAVRQVESSAENINSIKISTVIKQTIKAKCEQIKADVLITPGKRQNKNNSSTYTYDESVTFPEPSFMESTNFNLDDTETNIENSLEQRAYCVNTEGEGTDIISEIYNKIASKLDSNGIPLIRYFYRLPTRRKYPEYYDIISEPISFSNIRRRMIMKKYLHPIDLRKDVLLLFKNAMTYNEKNSLVYKIAEEFYEFAQSVTKDASNYSTKDKNDVSGHHHKRKRSTSEKITPKYKVKKIKTTPKVEERKKNFEEGLSLNKRLKKILSKILKLRDKTKERRISEQFKYLPLREDYPEYYEIISDPIDLKTIGEKIRHKQYKNIKHFITDIACLIANARFFNKTTSQIYKDTIYLEEFLIELLGQRVQEAINKKISDGKLPISGTLNDNHSVSKLINYVLRCTDKNNKKYITLAGISPEIKSIRNDLSKYETINDLYFALVELIKNHTDNVSKTSKQYLAGLNLLSILSRKVKEMISPNITFTFLLTPQQLITNIFKTLIDYRDDYNISYFDTLTAYSHKFKQNPNSSNSSYKSISIKSIEESIQNNSYSRFDCFQSDFFSICKGIRNGFDRLSEPYLHSVKMAILFLQQRDLIVKLNENYVTTSMECSLDEFEEEIQLDGDPQSHDLYCDNISVSKPNTLALSPATIMNISEASNYTDQEYTTDKLQIVSSVKYKDIFYNSGDAVVFSWQGTKYMALIRKLFHLPSGRKAFLGNIILKPSEVDLCYTRKYGEQELVLSNQYCVAKIRNISEKLSFVHAYQFIHYKPCDNKLYKVFFLHCIYDPSSKSLSTIGMDSNHIPAGFKLRKFGYSINRSQIIIPPNLVDIMKPVEQPATLSTPSLSLVYMLSSESFTPFVLHENFNFFNQIVFKNFVLRVGDFFRTNPSSPIIVYQIHEIFKKDLKYSLKCRKYISYDYLKICPTAMYFKNEVVQTDTYVDLEASDVANLICVLSKSQYLCVRPTQYQESDVYVCLLKYNEYSSEIISADDFNINRRGNYLDEFIYFSEPLKLPKFFGYALEFELDNLATGASHNDSSSVSEREDSDVSRKEVSRNIKVTKGKDKSISYANTVNVWRCQWGTCRESFLHHHELSYHFDIVHGSEIKLDFQDDSFFCVWSNCPRQKAPENSFPTFSRLQKHVREVHFKSMSSSKSLKYNEDESIGKENGLPATMKEVLNPLNKSVILLRDDYVSSLLRLINKQTKHIDDLTSLLQSSETPKNSNSSMAFMKSNMVPTISNLIGQPQMDNDSTRTSEKVLEHSEEYKKFCENKLALLANRIDENGDASVDENGKTASLMTPAQVYSIPLGPVLSTNENSLNIQ